jgi:hypothetical protein
MLVQSIVALAIALAVLCTGYLAIHPNPDAFRRDQIGLNNLLYQGHEYARTTGVGASVLVTRPTGGGFNAVIYAGRPDTSTLGGTLKTISGPSQFTITGLNKFGQNVTYGNFAILYDPSGVVSFVKWLPPTQPTSSLPCQAPLTMTETEPGVVSGGQLLTTTYTVNCQ